METIIMWDALHYVGRPRLKTGWVSFFFFFFIVVANGNE